MSVKIKLVSLLVSTATIVILVEFLDLLKDTTRAKAPPIATRSLAPDYSHHTPCNLCNQTHTGNIQLSLEDELQPRVQGTMTTREIEEEIGLIVERMHKCLEVTNVSSYFLQRGYQLQAENNVRTFMTAFRTVVPRQFNLSYYSPCWDVDYEVEIDEEQFHGKVGGWEVYSNTKDFGRILCKTTRSELISKHGGRFSSTLACLPKVFLIGFYKCGSTYLRSLLVQGVSVRHFTDKEPHFWVATNPEREQHPHTPSPSDVLLYMTNFAMAQPGFSHANGITADFTVNVIFDWTRYYRAEPPVNYCQAAAIIPKVLPEAKFIAVMRNPVHMLYSKFWFSCTVNRNHNLSRQLQLQGPDVFHERAVAKLTQFEECMRGHSLEWCTIQIAYDTYSPEFPCGKVGIDIGIYYVHIQKWLSVNQESRDNFLFLTLEEISKDQNDTLELLAEFVGVHNRSKINFLAKSDKNTQGDVDYHSPALKMRDDTEEMLTSFFHPYNQKLADLLGDDKFLWKS